MKYLLILLCFLNFIFPAYALASDSLLYLEAQGIIGYSSLDDKVIYHSAHEHDTMQKNSLGFDYIKKFSGEYEDIGTAALQMRLAYDDKDDEAEIQIYNAYLNGKTDLGNIWVGHNRIAFGLGSFWDTHADLLQPLSMYGFGFDRDWGIGINKDTQNGGFQFAFTSGSGMGIHTDGNWLITSRISNGVLSYENYNIGFSIMIGDILDVMGYKVMDDEPQEIILGSMDISYNYNRFEHKVEFDFGEKDDNTALAVFYRIGINFLEENRLKLEGQYVYTKHNNMSDYNLGTGITYKINSDLTARLMYQWQHEIDEQMIVAQIYYYFGL